MENGNDPEIPEGPEIADDPGIVINPDIIVHPVIFFVDRLRLGIEDDDTDDEEELQNNFTFLAGEYYMPLESILDSRLNAAGRINSVYANFGDHGCARINPQHAAFHPINLERFKLMLTSYISFGVVLDANGVEVWSRVGYDTSSILAGLPANTHVIGCVSGEGFPNAPNYLPYIQNLPEQPLAFVIGTATASEQHTDIIVKVAEFDPLLVEYIAFLICNALEQKWNIN